MGGSWSPGWINSESPASFAPVLAPKSMLHFQEKDSEVVLYEHRRKESGDDTAELVGQIVHWSYGCHFAEALPNGEVMVVYYAGTDTGMDIHWARLKVEPAERTDVIVKGTRPRVSVRLYPYHFTLDPEHDGPDHYRHADGLSAHSEIKPPLRKTISKTRAIF